MEILSLHPEIADYLKKHKLEKKFNKQARFLETDIRHPGLGVELLEPKHLKLFSFRVNRKYRAIFIFRDNDAIEIIDVNNHYQ